MSYIVYQRVSLKLWCVCCGRAGGNGQHSLDAFELKTSPPFLLLIYIYIYSSSPLLGVRSPPISFSKCACPWNLHSVRGCPKKVEKTSSENTTFAKSEHPYRTCGSPGGRFFFFDFPMFDQKSIIPFVAVPKKSKKTSSENITFENSEHPYRTCGSSGRSFLFFNFPIFDQKPIIPFEAVPKKSKKRQAKTRFSKTYHSVADVPKKVEKTSSENNTLTIFEHPYRTCGSGGSCGMWLLWLLWSAVNAVAAVAAVAAPQQILQTLCSNSTSTAAFTNPMFKQYIHVGSPPWSVPKMQIQYWKMQYLSNENEACNSGVSWLRIPGWRFLAEDSWLRNLAEDSWLRNPCWGAVKCEKEIRRLKITEVFGVGLARSA